MSSKLGCKFEDYILTSSKATCFVRDVICNQHDLSTLFETKVVKREKSLEKEKYFTNFGLQNKSPVEGNVSRLNHGQKLRIFSRV